MATTGNDLTEKAAIARFGYVSDYYATRHMARVKFPELDDLVSGWLQVGVPNTLKNHDEFHLDIGEHVFCILQGNGIESGIVLCSVYDDKNKPIVKNLDARVTTFEDGTIIEVDRAQHFVLIQDSVGDYILMGNGEMEIHANNHINITAGRIDLN